MRRLHTGPRLTHHLRPGRANRWQHIYQRQTTFSARVQGKCTAEPPAVPQMHGHGALLELRPRQCVISLPAVRTGVSWSGPRGSGSAQHDVWLSNLYLHSAAPDTQDELAFSNLVEFCCRDGRLWATNLTLQGGDGGLLVEGQAAYIAGARMGVVGIRGHCGPLSMRTRLWCYGCEWPCVQHSTAMHTSLLSACQLVALAHIKHRTSKAQQLT